MIIVKTTMTEMPKSCKECKLVLINYGLVACPILRDWLEGWQIKEGKVKQDNCPLEKV